jgi:hypothetical protein
MINFAYMPCPQSAGFRIGIAFLVATRTVIKFQFGVARLDRECGGLGVEQRTGLARVSLLGSDDAG